MRAYPHRRDRGLGSGLTRGSCECRPCACVPVPAAHKSLCDSSTDTHAHSLNLTVSSGGDSACDRSAVAGPHRWVGLASLAFAPPASLRSPSLLRPRFARRHSSLCRPRFRSPALISLPASLSLAGFACRRLWRRRGSALIDSVAPDRSKSDRAHGIGLHVPGTSKGVSACQLGRGPSVGIGGFCHCSGSTTAAVP